MLDNDAAAATLFGGSMNTAPKQDVQPTTKPTQQQQAERLFSGPEKQKDVFAEAFPPKDAKQDAPKQEPAKQEASEEAKADALTADDVTGIVEELGFEANEVTADFAELATDAGMNREQVSKLMDIKQQADAAAWDHIGDTWREESLSTFTEADIGVAKRALNEYGSPELMEMLNTYRLGNHPAVIGFLKNVAKGNRG